MKKIIVYAYTNFNLGDDLFIKVLCERYPNSKFILIAPKEYARNFSRNDNLKIKAKDSLFNKVFNLLQKKFKINNYFMHRVAKNCDIAINIGGSIFIENSNWKEKLNKRKKMLFSKQPYFLLGANFGPYNDKNFYIQHKELFKKYTDICFRENESYSLFNDLKNVRVASDIVFQLEDYADVRTKNKEKIGISVLKPSVRKFLTISNETYYEKIKDLIIGFSDKGYEVSLMSFCEKEGDEEAANGIIELLPKKYKKNISFLFYKNNIEEMLQEISKFKFVIATRFHAMILGWVFKKPVYPIVYSEKMTNVINDLNFKGNYTNIEDIKHLNFEEVLNSMEINSLDISFPVKDSKRQFEKLDKILLNKY